MSKQQQIAFNSGWNMGRWPDDPRLQVRKPANPELARHFDDGYRAGVDARRGPMF